MNLGKLLGSGKTFISGGKAAAYRTDKRVYLPQFVSPKNPFATPPTVPLQADLPKPATPHTADASAKSAPAWAKTQKMATQKPSTAPAGPARAANWTSKFNPVAIFRDAAPDRKRLPTPVQAELSLEKVKVVHNDLTDAEVEVVPMKSRPPRAPSAEAPPAKKTWSDLGERIIRATAL